MSTNVGQINYVVNIDTTQALASIDKLQKEANNLRAILGKPFVMKAKVDNTALSSITQQAQNVGKELQKSVSKELKTKVKVDNSDLAYTQKLFDRFKMSAKSGGVFRPEVDNKRLLTGLNAMGDQIKHFKDKAEVPIQVQVNAKNLSLLDNELKKVGKTLPELKQSLAKGISIDKFFNDARTLQNETQRIQAKWTKMSSSITSSTEKMINSFARFSAIVAKFTIGAGLVGFVKVMKDGIKSSLDIQDSLDALQNANIFQDYSYASKQMIKDWQELSSTVDKFDANGQLKANKEWANISIGNYIEGAERISMYLRDLNMTDQERVKAVKEFNKMTADMSSFWNEDIASIQDKLVRYMSGRPQAINMLVKGYDNFNIPTLNKQAEVLFGKSFSQLDFAQQKMVRMRAIFESMGVAEDDNIKATDILNFRWRIMAEQFKTVATTIGALLMPTFDKMLSKVGSGVNDLHTKFSKLWENPEQIKVYGEQISNVIFGKVIPMVKRAGAIISTLMLGSTFLKITGLSGAFAKQMPKLLGVVGEGGIKIGQKLFGDAGKELLGLSSKMPGILGPLTSAFGSSFGSIAASIGGASGAISTLGVGLVALPIIIAGVGGAFQGLFGTIKELPTIIEQNAGEGSFDKLKGSINGVKDNIMGMFNGIWGILKQFFGGIWGVGQSIGGAIGKVFGSIMLGLAPIIQFFTTIWNFVIRFIEKTGIIEIFFKNVKNFFTTVGNVLSATLMPIFQAIGDVFRDHIMPAIQPLIDKAMEFAPKVRAFFEWLSGMWTQYIAPTLEWLGKILGDTIAPIISTIGEIVGWAIGTAIDWLLKAWDNVSWFWGKITEFFGDIKGGWNGLKDWVIEKWNGLLDWARNIDIIEAFFGAMKSIGTWLDSNVLQPIKDWFSSLPSKIGSAVKNVGTSIWNGIKDAIGFSLEPTLETPSGGNNNVVQRQFAMANEINSRMARARDTLFSTQRDTMKASVNSVIINIDNSNSVIPEQFANEIVNTTMTTLGGAYGLVR